MRHPVGVVPVLPATKDVAAAAALRVHAPRAISPAARTPVVERGGTRSGPGAMRVMDVGDATFMGGERAVAGGSRLPRPSAPA